MASMRLLRALVEHWRPRPRRNAAPPAREPAGLKALEGESARRYRGPAAGAAPVKLAGPFARLRFDPNSSPDGPDDIDEAIQWVPDDAIYELLAAEAERIVDTHWQVIEYVVKTLLKQKRAADGGQTLSARAIRAAMKRAGWFAGQW